MLTSLVFPLIFHMFFAYTSTRSTHKFWLFTGAACLFFFLFPFVIILNTQYPLWFAYSTLVVYCIFFILITFITWFYARKSDFISHWHRHFKFIATREKHHSKRHLRLRFIQLFLQIDLIRTWRRFSEAQVSFYKTVKLLLNIPKSLEWKSIRSNFRNAYVICSSEIGWRSAPVSSQ